MSGKYLLDTSIIVELFANDRAVHKRLLKAESVFIPSIAVGELYYGANKSASRQENMDQVKRLVSISIILNFDTDTGYWYGTVKTNYARMENLRQKTIFGSRHWLCSMI